MSSNAPSQESPIEEADNLDTTLIPEDQQSSSNSNQNDDFEQTPLPQDLSEEGLIKQVLGYFVENTYNASEMDPRVQIALDKCIEYIDKDYVTNEVDNTNGNLSTFYPAIIPFIVGERTSNDDNSTSAKDLSELLSKAHRARCRERFPVPVIMYNGKTICRSATLAGCAEIYGRVTLDVLRPFRTHQTDSNIEEMIESQLTEEEKTKGWKTLYEVQAADIELLKELNVSTIVDLMVENRKCKLGIPVTSSEKVDKNNKYHIHFNILSLPFPGCEFFKDFYDRNYTAEGLVFNWDQPMCDAELTIPNIPSLDHLGIKWNEYKSWDLIQITQNYIKFILNYFQETDNGILIHCISGWDRTPLFICLLRLSLWADGLIHKSLNVKEMLCFTLAYDWMLFGHHLSDRLDKNEHILLFCFTVLKHLSLDEFSLASYKTDQHNSSSDLESVKSSSGKSEEYFSFEEDDSNCVKAVDEEMPLSPEPVNFPNENNDEYEAESQPSTSSGEMVNLPELTTPVPIAENDGSVPVPMEIIGDGTENSSLNPEPVAKSPREESSSSSSQEPTSGWNVVTSSGSLHTLLDYNSDEDTSSQGSSNAIAEDINLSRKEKLSQIRRLFCKYYYQSVANRVVTTPAEFVRDVLRHLAEIAEDVNENYYKS